MNRRSTPPTLRVICVVLAAAALTACGPESVTPDAALVCDDIAVLDEAIVSFRNLTPETASVDDYRQGWDTIREAFEVVVMDREALAETDMDRMQQAFDDLGSAVEDLPDDANLPEAVETLEPAIEELGAAHDEITTDLECVPT